MSIIEEECSDHKRNLFIARYEQMQKQAQEDSEFWNTAMQKVLMALLGKIDYEKENGVADPDSVYLKYHRIDKNEIDYQNSDHSMVLQNSDYV